MDTRDKNGKTYYWCTKHNLWTLHMASECKLESPKGDSHNKVEEEHKLQLKQALTAMEDDNESIEWLLSLWFVRILSSYIRKMIMDKVCLCNTDHRLQVSYHFIIYIYVTSIITVWIRTILARIKDRTIYWTKGKSIKTISNKRKGHTKYYFKSHKRHSVGRLKPRKHKRQGIGQLKPRYKPTNMNAYNTIVYKTSINKTSITNHWDQESYPIAIDSCCSVSIAKKQRGFHWWTTEVQREHSRIQRIHQDQI